MPVGLFFGAVTNVLYYFGAIQLFIKTLGWLIQSAVGTGAIESFVAASNIFLSPVSCKIGANRLLVYTIVLTLYAESFVCFMRLVFIFSYDRLNL